MWALRAINFLLRISFIVSQGFGVLCFHLTLGMFFVYCLNSSLFGCVVWSPWVCVYSMVSIALFFKLAREFCPLLDPFYYWDFPQSFLFDFYYISLTFQIDFSSIFLSVETLLYITHRFTYFVWVFSCWMYSYTEFTGVSSNFTRCHYYRVNNFWRSSIVRIF